MELKQKIQLNTRFEQEAPEGTISDTGINRIQDYIQDQDLTTEMWHGQQPQDGATYLRPLPYNWEWVWKVTGNGHYVGTFPKRAGKYYYKQWDVKLPTAFVAQLGNLAREHSEDRSFYRFDFVNEFNWQDGDFGDYDSCFWGENSRARDLLKDNGAYAVRFFGEEGTGLARAWVAHIADERLIVFNGYGFSGNPTLKIAQVVARFTGQQYERIYVTNHNTDEGTLWINGSTGYLIGTAEQLANMTEYDFGWGSVEDDG
ncbi:MAG: hypothetical protein AAF653_18105 [Chloroflexota bacterium]